MLDGNSDGDSTQSLPVYIKASTADAGGDLGSSASLSGDGGTVVVEAGGEETVATRIDGDQSNNDAYLGRSAFLLIRRDDNVRSQQVHVEASNTDAGDGPNSSMPASGDGDSLALVAAEFDSSADRIGSDENNNNIGVERSLCVLTAVQTTRWPCCFATVARARHCPKWLGDLSRHHHRHPEARKAEQVSRVRRNGCVCSCVLLGRTDLSGRRGSVGMSESLWSAVAVCLCLTLQPILTQAGNSKRRTVLVLPPRFLTDKPYDSGRLLSEIRLGAENAVKEASPMYDAVVTASEIGFHSETVIRSIAQFGEYVQDRLYHEIKSRNQLVGDYKLVAVMQVVFRVSTNGLVADLRLHTVDGRTLLGHKEVGGCGGSFEDVAIGLREAVYSLVAGVKDTPPVIRLRALGAARNVKGRTYVTTDEETTLDSCQSYDSQRDFFSVRWEQTLCGDLQGVPCDVIRRATVYERMIRLSLPQAGTYHLTLEAVQDNEISTTGEIALVAVERAQATPIVSYWQPQRNPKTGAAGSASAPASDDVCRDLVRMSRGTRVGWRELTIVRNAENKRSGAVLLPMSGKYAVLKLDGHSSTPAKETPNGTSIRWTKVSGPDVHDADGSSAGERYYCIERAKFGLYVFALTVTSGATQDSQHIRLLVAPRPHVDPGENIDVLTNHSVTLDGRASYDLIDPSPLYSWFIGPEEGAHLRDPHLQTPTFVARKAGEYDVTLVMRAHRLLGSTEFVDVDSRSIRATVYAHSAILVLGFEVASRKSFLGSGVSLTWLAKAPVDMRLRLAAGMVSGDKSIKYLFSKSRSEYELGVDMGWPYTFGASTRVVPYFGAVVRTDVRGVKKYRIGPNSGAFLAVKMSRVFGLVLDVSVEFLGLDDSKDRSKIDIRGNLGLGWWL